MLGPHPSTACSTAAISGSQGTTEPARDSAVCGSLRPWPVSTHATRSASSAPCLSRPGHARRGGGLAEHALVRGQEAVGVEDLVVRDGADRAVRGGHRAHRLLPPGRVADPDRARDGLGLRHRRAVHERRRPLGLPAEHARARAGLAEARPVGGDVPRVADGDAERVEAVAELVDDLERGGLLALEPERVDGVDERDRMARGQLAHERERLVEVAAQRDHARAVHQRLGQLAGGDLAVGHDHGARQAGARGVGGGAGRRVAGRGADHRLGAVAHGGRDRAGHAPVLERAGRVRALELEPHLGADPLGDALGEHQRGRALEQRHDGILRRERQPVAEALDQPDPAQMNSSSMTRIARGAERMKSSRPIRRTAA